MEKHELLQLYMSENKKKVFGYIYNFLSLILSRSITPMLDEDWETVQTNKNDVIFYCRKQQLLMQIKEYENQDSEISKNIQVHIIKSQDIGYKGKQLVFDKHNFEQFEIRQFWFNAIAPKLIFSPDNYFVPERQSLFYFLNAFKLDKYFTALTSVTDNEKQMLKTISLGIVDNLEKLGKYYNHEHIDWQDGDKSFKFIFDEVSNAWSGYYFGGNQIHDSIVMSTPNIQIQDNEVVFYDKIIYQFFEQLEKLHQKIKNISQHTTNNKIKP